MGLIKVVERITILNVIINAIIIIPAIIHTNAARTIKVLLPHLGVKSFTSPLVRIRTILLLYSMSLSTICQLVFFIHAYFIRIGYNEVIL